MQVWLPPGADVSVNLSAAHAGETFLRDCRRLQQQFRNKAYEGDGHGVTEPGGVQAGSPGGASLLKALQAAGIRVTADRLRHRASGDVGPVCWRWMAWA
jgi:hypothetical protein